MRKQPISIKFLIALIILLIFFASPSLHSRPPKQDEIVIGAVLPLTGFIASAGGEDGRNGMELAVEEINKAGGIKGRKINFIIEDSKSTTADGLNGFNHLLNTKDPNAVLAIGSALSLTIAPIAKSHHIPVLATITTSYKVTQQNDHMFRYYTDSAIEAAALTKLLERERSKKVAVLYLEDESTIASLDKLRENYQADFVTEAFQTSTSDFRTQLLKIKSQNPDSIVILGFVNHITNAIKQIKELNVKTKIFSWSLVTQPDVQKFALEQGVTIYAGAPKIYGEELSGSVEQVKGQYEAKYHKPFNHYAASGYDSIKLLEQAMEEKGIERQQIQQGLSTISQFEGLLGNAKISQREFNFELYPGEVKDGKFVRVIREVK